MDVKRVPKSYYEGKTIVESISELGSYGVGAWDAESVAALGKPDSPNCGTCCHPTDHAERNSYTIVGVVRSGRVHGDKTPPEGLPLEKWFPYVKEG